MKAPDVGSVYLMATLDEDGPLPVSPFFKSRRKLGRWKYSRKWLLQAKRHREAAIGRITGMDEEVDMTDHLEQIKVERADVRRGPRGWVVEVDEDEREDWLASMAYGRDMAQALERIGS